MIRGKLDRAMRGEADPTADDPDPLEGWRAQYLNVWPLADVAKVEAGDPLVTQSSWTGLEAGVAPAGPPAVAAVESWFHQGVCVAYAWPLPGDQLLVGVSAHGTLAEAARAVSAAAPAVLLVGKTLADDPCWLKSPTLVEPIGATTRQCVHQLRRLLDDQLLVHDGSPVLTEQVLAVRTRPGADGPRLVSAGRSDAVKAAAWAAQRLRAGVQEVGRIF
jgi:hypothetical protein